MVMYDDMTNAEFDSILVEVVDEKTMKQAEGLL